MYLQSICTAAHYIFARVDEILSIPVKNVQLDFETPVQGKKGIRLILESRKGDHRTLTRATQNISDRDAGTLPLPTFS